MTGTGCNTSQTVTTQDVMLEFWRQKERYKLAAKRLWPKMPAGDILSMIICRHSRNLAARFDSSKCKLSTYIHNECDHFILAEKRIYYGEGNRIAVRNREFTVNAVINPSQRPQDNSDLEILLQVERIVFVADKFLSKRESEIVFGRAIGMTLAELAQKLKITRERVRQISLFAFTEIRQILSLHPEIKAPADYYLEKFRNFKEMEG